MAPARTALVLAAIFVGCLRAAQAVAGGWGDVVVPIPNATNSFRPAIACNTEHECLIIVSTADGDARVLAYMLRKEGESWEPRESSTFSTTVYALDYLKKGSDVEWQQQIAPSVAAYGGSAGWVVAYRQRDKLNIGGERDSLRIAYITSENARKGQLWIGEEEGVGLDVSHSPDGGIDRNPGVAADLEGNIVVLWESLDPNAVDGINIGTDKDLVSVTFSLKGKTGDALRESEISSTIKVFPDSEVDIFQDRDPVMTGTADGRIVVASTASIAVRYSDIMISESSTTSCAWKSRVRVTNLEMRDSDVMVVPSPHSDHWLAIWTQRGTGIMQARLIPDVNGNLKVESTSYINPLAFPITEILNAKPVLMADPTVPGRWAAIYAVEYSKTTQMDKLVFQLSEDDGLSWGPAYFFDPDDRDVPALAAVASANGVITLAFFDREMRVVETTATKLFNTSSFSDDDRVELPFVERETTVFCVDFELPKNGSVANFTGDDIGGIVPGLARCLRLVAPETPADVAIHMNLEVLVPLEPMPEYEESCPFSYFGIRKSKDPRDGDFGLSDQDGLPRRLCTPQRRDNIQVNASEVFVIVNAADQGVSGESVGAVPIAMQAWATPARDGSSHNAADPPTFERRSAGNLAELRGHLQDSSFTHGEISIFTTNLGTITEELVIRAQTNISLVSASGSLVSLSGSNILRVDPGAVLWRLAGLSFSRLKGGERFGGMVLVLGHLGRVENCHFQNGKGARVNKVALGGGLTVVGRVDSIVSTIFYEISGRMGGAVGVTKTGRIGLIEDSTFESTFEAAFQGSHAGAVYVAGLIETISRTVFDNCTCTGAGGAIYVESGGEITRILDSAFLNNTAQLNGGAIEFKKGAKVPVTWQGGRFQGNKANGGAAIHAVGVLPALNAESGTRFSKLEFAGNVAHQGGAIFLEESPQVSQFLLEDVRFDQNTASHGAGGGLLASGAVVLELANASFTFNSAATTGGAIALTTGAQANLLASSLASNSAARQGGAIFAGAATSLGLTAVHFLDNAANLTCREEIVCSFEPAATVASSRAVCGTGTDSDSQCQLVETSDGHEKIGCAQGVGGSIYLGPGVTSHIHRCTFAAAEALPNIGRSDPFTREDGEEAFYSDEAGRFVYSESRFRLSETSFGGDAYAFAPPTAVIGCPATCSSTGTCIASEESAPSVNCTCQGSHDGSNGYDEGGCTTLRVARVQESSAAQRFSGKDAGAVDADGFATISWQWPYDDVDYFVVFRTENRSWDGSSTGSLSACASESEAASTVAPCVKIENPATRSLALGLRFGESSFFRVIARIDNQDTVPSEPMSLASIICQPGEKRVSTQEDGAFACEPCPRGTFSQGTAADCQKCPNDLQVTVGVATSEADCVAPAGFYLVDGDQDSKAQVVPCSDGLNCTDFGQSLQALELEPGYWRPSLDAETVYACPNADACLGGNGTAAAGPGSRRRRELSLWTDPLYCRLGHTGPFCSVCQPGYSKDSNGLCSPCTSQKVAHERAVLGLAGTLIFMLWPIIIAATYYRSLRSEAPPRRRRHWFTNAICNLRTRIRYWRDISIRLRGPVTITIGLIQVVIGFHRVFSPTYSWWLPWGILQPVSAALNIDASTLPSATGCVLEDNHANRLLIATTLPAILILLVAIAFGLTRRFAATNEDHRAKLASSTWYIVAFLMFLVFPSVNITIAQSFVCDTFEDGSATLRFDHASDCSDLGWLTIYAGVMAFVYLAGPVALFVYLIGRDEEDAVQGGEFLRRLYRQETRHKGRNVLLRVLRVLRRYYEVFELLRKYLLTSAVLLVGDGTVGQVAFAMFVCFLATMLQTTVTPYVELQNNVLATVVHMELYFVLSALLISPVVADLAALEIVTVAVISVGPLLALILITLQWLVAHNQAGAGTAEGKSDAAGADSDGPDDLEDDPPGAIPGFTYSLPSSRRDHYFVERRRGSSDNIHGASASSDSVVEDMEPVAELAQNARSAHLPSAMDLAGRNSSSFIASDDSSGASVVLSDKDDGDAKLALQ